MYCMSVFPYVETYVVLVVIFLLQLCDKVLKFLVTIYDKVHKLALTNVVNMFCDSFCFLASLAVSGLAA